MLPVILVILLTLAMIGAALAFFTSAELGAAEARANRLQTRLAAEAGLQRILLLLRQHRSEMSYWWDNKDLHGVQIWPSAKEGESFESRTTRSDTQDKEKGEVRDFTPRWRYSIVAADLDRLELERKPIRYGMQDESGKLNINWATREQLLALFSAVVDPELPVEELVDCLMDWRDEDENVSAAGAESSYYMQLPIPYRSGNAPLKTIEEMLLIKNFTARVVYGEDYNRNGILEQNEDDGLATFPPDNADGRIDVGLLPYTTVYSMGQDRASDNKPRIYLNSKPEELAVVLPFVMDASVAEFIVEMRRKNKVFESPAELGGDIKEGNDVVPSPVSPEEMLMIMDRLTTVPRPPGVGALQSMVAMPLPHVINVNTAPPPVLACLGLSSEQIEQIVGVRRQLGDRERCSPGWLINQGIMTPTELAKFTGKDPRKLHIVTQSWQFTVESVGYGDHVGMMCRLQIVIEMQGQLPLVKYIRDISKLGPAWPVRLEEESREITGASG